jgi:tRNA A-37 threonylcarbamoyl transferase component Bud32
VIEAVVGQGSAGTVHRAVHERTRQIVALKLVTDPALRARFVREAATLARLEHDAIVRYFEHGETPQGMYLAMEWLDGEDLEQRLRRGPLGWREARRLGLRLASALAYAHARGCVHRDLSPRNVFLPRGSVDHAKLIDFGLVRVQDGELARTTSQAVLGTPFYMAPEQVRDPRNVDGRTDLFGLGVLLFEATSGVRPFEGEDLFTVWVRIVDQPAPDLRQLVREAVPERFVRLVEHLLAKDPNARPRSADDVCRALQELDEGPGTAPLARPLAAPAAIVRLAPPPPPSWPTARAISDAPPRSSAGIWVVGVVGLASLLLVGVAGALLVRYGARPPVAASGSAEPPVAASAAAPSAASPASAAPAAGHAFVDPSTATTTHVFCGQDAVEDLRGGSYAARPDMKDMTYAVVTGGNCRLTLENCTIAGPLSAQVMGDSTLVLRRCVVHGEVRLLGATTLHLEGTKLPKPPVLLGAGGKVVTR